MDALSGNLVTILIVVINTTLGIVLYVLLDLVLLKLLQPRSPRYYFAGNCMLACILMLPMLVLVWDFSYTNTVFSALPPFLTALLPLYKTCRFNIKSIYTRFLLLCYVATSLIFLYQYIIYFE